MAIANVKQLIAEFESHPVAIRSYFEHLPKLVSADFPYEVALAYVFFRIERAHRRTLYCGIVKKYSANSDMTDDVTRSLYLKRDEFLELFSSIFGDPIDPKILQLLKNAERARDKGIHGKEPTNAEMRDGLKAALDYAAQLDEFVFAKGGFRPFGDLRGFKGRAESMDNDTTRLVLKGLGFKMA